MTSGVYYWEFQGDQRTENELKIGITGDRDFNFNTVVDILTYNINLVLFRP